MKRIFYALFISALAAVVTSAPAQSVCQGDVVITSQAEADNFNCSKVTGTLLISGADVRDLSHLSKLEEVVEDFSIIGTSITSLDGLQNLKRMGCSLKLEGNNSLETTQDLQSLDSIGMNLFIVNNRVLYSVKGFENLDSLDYLVVNYNPKLARCCELNDLVNGGRVRKNIDVHSNGPLCGEALITSCSDCSGDFFIYNQFDADQISCTVIDGNLFIRTSEALDLSALKQLTGVKGNVTLEVGKDFSLEFLENVEFIDGTLSFTYYDLPTHELGNANLSELKSLKSLEGLKVYRFTLQGAFPVLDGNLRLLHLVYLAELEDTSWLENIDNIQVLKISNDTSFERRKFSPYLEKLKDDGELELIGTYIENLNELKGITRLKSLRLLYVNALSLDGLSDLIYTDEFYLSDNWVLGSACGVYNYLVNGNEPEIFRIYYNNFTEEEILATCGELPDGCDQDVRIESQADADAFNCPLVEGDLIIKSLEPLDLSSFSVLYGVAGDLGIHVENDFHLYGMENLRRVGGMLDISGAFEDHFTVAFVDLAELSGLRSTRGMRVSLASITNFPGILYPDWEKLELGYVADFSDLNWLGFCNTDTLILTENTYDGEQFLRTLNNGGYFLAESFDFRNFYDLRDITYLQGLELVNLWPGHDRTFEGMANLERVDRLALENVYATDCCGLYNLLKNGTVGSILWKENSCTIEEILSTCGEAEEVATLTIYPNPSSSTLVNVEWDAATDKKSMLEVLDNNGKVMNTIQIEPGASHRSWQLDVNGMPSGIYLVRIITGDQVQLKRLLIK